MMIFLAVAGRMSMRNYGRQETNSSNSDMELFITQARMIKTRNAKKDRHRV